MRKTSSLLLALALLLGFLTPSINASPLLDTKSIATDAIILAEQPYYRGNEVYTGTEQSVFRITNAGGITGLEETPGDLANYSVEILSQTSTTVEVRVTSELYIDTNQAFPIKASSIPDELDQYLLSTNMAQSNDPMIIALANELSSGCTIEGQVVDAIISWVRSHIDYDYYNEYKTDAVSVLENRKATCAGFMQLSLALLRASGIPARYVTGAATPYGFTNDPAGGGHGWIEVYYPDAGWAPCDPETSANYIDSSVIRGGFDQCGEEGTTIERLSFTDNTELLYRLKLPYDDIPTWAYTSGYITSASISSWNRQPIAINPTPTIVLNVDNPTAQFYGTVTSNSSYDYWRVSESSSLLSLSAIQGMRDDPLRIDIDATGMNPGIYEIALTFTDGQLLEGIAWKAGPATCTVPVKLIIMEDANEVYLPRISK